MARSGSPKLLGVGLMSSVAAWPAPAVSAATGAALKVLLCHNQYRQRTGEDIAFDLARSLLQAAGYSVSLHTRSSRETDQFAFFEKLSFPWRVIYSSASRCQVRDLLHRERPDVAIVQNVFPLLSPSVYYAFAEARVPVVQFVFNYRLLCANGQLFTNGQICERCVGGNYLHGVVHRCYRDSYTFSALYGASLGLHRRLRTWERCIRLFVVPDAFLRDKLIEAGLPADRFRVVPNPFQVEDYQPHYQRGDYALFVGRLIRAKGIFTLLDSALRLAAPRIVIAGDGEEADAVCRHPAVVQGRVEFVGPAYGQRMAQLLDNCGCVVVPSEWYDNLPMIACQAFACGKPVVASRINGIPEYVRNEENGLLFTPGNANELAACVERLFADADLYARVAGGARRTAETVLAPAAWLKAMGSILTEVRDLTPRGTS
ncbi:MAG: glycosyltransferase [Acidobacteriia bacterium]|nr:glycosyltransferase [Terriglobia bacterium]